MGTAPGPQFIRLSKYNCAAGPRSSTPFINSNVSVSGTTPHSSHHCADPMGLLIQDKWMDPPHRPPCVQDLWVSGTYKLQLFWSGCNVFYRCKTSHLLRLLGGTQSDPSSILFAFQTRRGLLKEESALRIQTKTKYTRVELKLM